MTEKAVGMRAGEDDGADRGVAIGAIDQRLQLLGHRGIEQRMRAAVEMRDEDGPVRLHRDLPGV